MADIHIEAVAGGTCFRSLNQEAYKMLEQSPPGQSQPDVHAATYETIAAIHRKRRFAIKLQQKIDRALESFIRVNETDWSPDMDEKERAKYNKEVAAIVEAARKGEGDPEIIAIVTQTDASRKPADQMRKKYEKIMTECAASLPIAPWIEAIPGAGLLGLATIIGEAGPLDRYPNPAKLWKRLGYAPYDGHAGSTWKRKNWRPRTLTDEEWIANPFSGARYAAMAQIATWLRNKQWIGAAKTESGEGEPDGFYGEIYAARRRHTAETQPDWTKGHADKDALRIMMKAFLKNLWKEWNKAP
jgi:hypothetical protein